MCYRNFAKVDVSWSVINLYSNSTAPKNIFLAQTYEKMVFPKTFHWNKIFSALWWLSCVKEFLFPKNIFCFLTENYISLQRENSEISENSNIKDIKDDSKIDHDRSSSSKKYFSQKWYFPCYQLSWYSSYIWRCFR